jgi:hypothetical protein
MLCQNFERHTIIYHVDHRTMFLESEQLSIVITTSNFISILDDRIHTRLNPSYRCKSFHEVQAT